MDKISLSQQNELDEINNIEIKKTYKIPQKIIKDTLGLDSLVFSFFTNGKVYERLPYKNGKLHGRVEEYYFNGQLKIRTYFNNGIQIDGISYMFNINGSILSIAHYKNGHEYGYTKTYFNDCLFNIRKYNKSGKFKQLYIWDEKKERWIKSPDY